MDKAREIAMLVVYDVSFKGAYANMALKDYFQKNKEISKIGNKIIIDDGKIKINDDIGKILISVKVQMTLKNNSGNTKNIYIHKNSASIIDVLNEVYRTSDNWRFSASTSDIPISVAKNDVIELKGYFGVGDIIQNQSSRTYITVKEV